MKQLISFRGSSGWSGIVDTTEIGIIPGALRELEDAVVSEDGSEIRPAPGCRVAAKPFHGQAFTTTTVTPGVSTTTIVLDATQENSGNAFLPSSFDVYIPADDAIYVATRTAKATFTIPTITSTVIAGDQVLVKRKSSVHALQTADGKATVVVETVTSRDGSGSYNNLATTVADVPLSITDPPGPGVPDGTDAGCVLWPSPTMWAMTTAEYSGNTSAVGALRHFEILRRMHTASLNGRVLIAVPGHGCMFSANVRNHFETLGVRPPLNTSWPDSRWTKMLGIPRGILGFSAITASSGGSVSVGNWFTFAVGYYDPYTGEAGLPSPPMSIYVASGATNRTLNIAVAYPRGIAMETAGLQLVLYASNPMAGANTDADHLLALAQQLYPYANFGPQVTTSDKGLISTSGVDTFAPTTYTFVIAQDPDDQAQVAPRRVPAVELPPPGASWVSVAKSRAFSGGDMPSYWDFPGWPKATAILGGLAGSLDNDYYVILPTEWNVSQGIKASAPLALGKIPTAFNGRIISEVGSYDASGTLTLGTGNTSNIGRNIGQDNGQRSGTGPHAYNVEFRSGDTSTFDLDNLREYRIFTPSDLVVVAEEAAPAVFPATSYLPVDGLEVTSRTTGAARLGDQHLLFTQRQTYLFSWASLPQYSSAIVLSNVLGCASPHSAVEANGFCAWLSRRGPCVSSGGPPQFIGSKIQQLWATLKRDSEGMVICAGSGVDMQRSLIMWAVRVDDEASEWTAATTDQLKSKVSCDRLLVWNFVSNGFSLIRRDGQRRISAMNTMIVDDGVDRIAFTSAGSAFTDDKYEPVYAMDGVVERAAAVSEFSITARRDPSVSTVAIDNADQTIGESDNVFIRSVDGTRPLYVGRSSAAAGASSVALASADGANWAVGDVVVANGPYLRARWHRARVWPGGVVGMATGVVIDAQVDAEHAYVKGSLINEDGTRFPLGPLWGQRILTGSTPLRASMSATGIGIELEFFGDGAFAIKDVSLEVESGPRS